MLSRLPITLALLASSALPAASQALDCDKLLHSKMPFELEMRTLDKTLPIQVYRSDKLYRVQYTMAPDGKVTKFTFQATFTKSIRRPDQKVATVDWSVPTDKYFWDRGVSSVESHVSDSPPDKKDRTTYKVLGDEVINVGPCLIDTKHYAASYDRTLGLVKAETWFSTDLQAPLKSILTLRKGSETKEATNEAIDIRVSFVPMQ